MHFPRSSKDLLWTILVDRLDPFGWVCLLSPSKRKNANDYHSQLLGKRHEQVNLEAKTCESTEWVIVWNCRLACFTPIISTSKIRDRCSMEQMLHWQIHDTAKQEMQIYNLKKETESSILPFLKTIPKIRLLRLLPVLANHKSTPSPTPVERLLRASFSTFLHQHYAEQMTNGAHHAKSLVFIYSNLFKFIQCKSAAFDP